MFFTLNEIVSWLGITAFEIWINILSLIVATFLLAFQCDDTSLDEIDWWKVFLPLYVADGLNCYFCVVIFIRTYLGGHIKHSILRLNWSLCVLSLIFVFKFLLCKKLSGQSGLEYSEIFSPLFILLQLFAARACQMH